MPAICCDRITIVTPVGQTVGVSKSKTAFVCSECGTHHPKWSGQCSGCGEWNTLIEEVISTGLAAGTSSPSAPRPSSVDARPPVALDDTTTDVGTAQPTSVAELDHVLSGGFVDGSVTLLEGEPGIGKHASPPSRSQMEWLGAVRVCRGERSTGSAASQTSRSNPVRCLAARRTRSW